MSTSSPLPPTPSAPAPATAPAPNAPRPRRTVGWWIVRIVGIIALILLAAVLAFVIWALWIPAPMPEALAALESDAAVTVTEGDPITFVPTAAAPTCGFIFYQGGRVDERSYAPALRAVAEAGYFVATPSMPLNLAVMAPGKAQGIIDAHPEITTWVLGGHSLGGSMAANFVRRNPEATDGIAFWASYPAGGDDLSTQIDLAIGSISGTLDGLATPADIEASRALLPAASVFTPIQGGNHAQFGWYGDQRGDNPATITREEQQAQAVAATLATMGSACGRP